MYEVGEIIQNGIFDLQVCVPKAWTDELVKAFADRENPSGIESGWVVMKEGHKFLGGDPERVTCADNVDKVHMRLEC